MQVVQIVETALEREALTIAQVFDEKNPAIAQDKLRDVVARLRLTRGEVGALANIVTCMVHGQVWKKGGPVA